MLLVDFTEKIKDELTKRLGSEYIVRIHPVNKNNDTVLTGLMVSRVGDPIAPTLYMEILYKEYEAGTTLSELVNRLVSFFIDNCNNKPKLEEDFFSFDKVKDSICMKLVSKKGNEEIIKNCPYIEYLDLLICFYCLMKNDEIGRGTILIRNNHLDMWGQSVDSIYKYAKKNTEKLLPPYIKGMGELVEEITGDSLGANELAMKIVSNKDKYFGASVMLYKNCLKCLSVNFSGDFYIIPSSIHEFIAAPYTGNSEEIKSIIKEVNENDVNPEDVLSYSLYLYDALAEEIRVV